MLLLPGVDGPAGRRQVGAECLQLRRPGPTITEALNLQGQRSEVTTLSRSSTFKINLQFSFSSASNVGVLVLSRGVASHQCGGHDQASDLSLEKKQRKKKAIRSQNITDAQTSSRTVRSKSIKKLEVNLGEEPEEGEERRGEGGAGWVEVGEGEGEPESQLTPCVCVLLCVSVGSLGPGASWKCLGSAEAANTSPSIRPVPPPLG